MAEEYKVIRDSINGKKKYCRIPIRSRMAEVMQESGIYELNAEKILEMPHDTAIRTIDAILYDWKYWLNRANELFVILGGMETDKEKGKK